MQLTQENHYVPQSYLKRWASKNGKIWASRLLVPDTRMPLWKQVSVRGIAKHQNLYTRIIAGKESDDVEHWLNAEFETPAQEALAKATSNQKLRPEDWRHIIQFLAAQDVRTPARLHESLVRWQNNLQTTIEEVLEDSVKELMAAKQGKTIIDTTPHPHATYLPIKTIKEISTGAEYGRLGVEMIVGRGLWLFSLKHLLTDTLRVLFKHKWTILKCPAGMSWFTTDDPVLKLNYHSANRYDFGGGWGSEGTEIFMPLSPEHLLYTRVGHRPAARGTVLSPKNAQDLQRMMVQHAHRFVFSTEPDVRLPGLRLRHVSSEIFESEARQWKTWHDEQTKAEQELATDCS